MDLSHYRNEYSIKSLDAEKVKSSPIDQFGEWFAGAERLHVFEPNTMILATANAAGVPSARVVLLKKFDERGFVFFTNYDSRKGLELYENENGALVFYWAECERQIRIEGTIDMISGEESDVYFETRPEGSRLAAWASPQSRPVINREWLDSQISTYKHMYAKKFIPRPENWGGYRLTPLKMEFWQGRPDRLHDRILYQRQGDAWKIQRLAP
jgi:pyridoxamine 5'-phosphate oxidase